MMAYQNNQATTSSPDPLNDTTLLSSPFKTRTTPQRRRQSVLLQRNPPRKQTFELDVGDRLSPQKLRVTVEANDPNKENVYFARERTGKDTSPYYQPTIRPNERTRTTRIPVKGLSDSEDDGNDLSTMTPKRGRARPPKSTGTPNPSKTRTRSITPGARSNSRRRRTLGSLIDGDDSDDWDFALSDGVEIGRGKGRSRAGSIKSSTRKRTPAAGKAKDFDNLLSSATSLKGRGRRQTLMPEEFQILEDPAQVLLSDVVDDEHIQEEATPKALSNLDVNVSGSRWLYSPALTPYPRKGNTKIQDGKWPRLSVEGAVTHIVDEEQTAYSHANDILSDLPDDKTQLQPNRLSTSLPLEFSNVPAEQAHQNFTVEMAKIQLNGSEQTDTLHNDGVVEDDHEHFQYNDTILESEGFSMISVDSVPSIREHLSSPLSQPISHLGDTKFATPMTDTSAALPTRIEDSFSSIAPEVLAAATPGRNLANPRLLMLTAKNHRRVDDSFSSIPPEILEAASPARQLQNKRVQALKPTPQKARDDSFSSIPPEILEAATPARHRQHGSNMPNKAEMNDSLVADHSLAVPTAPDSAPSGRNVSSRLLTPDKTPSPPLQPLPESIEQASEKLVTDCGAAQAILQPLLSPFRSSINHIDSSPPYSMLSQHDSHVMQNSEDQSIMSVAVETPSMIFSSPKLPPHLQPDQISSSFAAALKPSLSPIVRAGRSLQVITAPISSGSHSSKLRSPFTSPRAQRSSTGVLGQSMAYVTNRDSREEEKRSEPNIIARSHLALATVNSESSISSTSRRQRHVRTAEASLHEDPFENSSIKQTASSMMQEKTSYKLELPQGPFHYSDEPNQGIRVPEKQAISDTPMEEESESSMNSPEISVSQQRVQMSIEDEWAAERAAVSREIESASTSQVIVISSDDSLSIISEQENEIAEDSVLIEEDIWQVEARHSSSLVQEQTKDDPEEQNIVSIPQGGKASTSSSTMSTSDVQAFSKLSPHDVLMTRGNVEKTATTSHKGTVTRLGINLEPIAADEDVPDLSEMWHIPQKMNFTPRSRAGDGDKLDFSALLASSPIKFSPRISNYVHSAPGVEGSPPYIQNSSVVALNECQSFPNESKSIEDMNGLNFSSPTQQSIEHDDPCPEHDSSGTETEELSAVTETSFTDTDESEIDRFKPPARSSMSPSPKKSCLRLPTSQSPTKNVSFFVNANAAVRPVPPPQLSGTTWSKAHWKLLDKMYQDFIADPTSLDYCPLEKERAKESKYLGLQWSSQGENLKVQLWHLVIVDLFLQEVPGWEEGDIVKRLCSVIVGDKRRNEKNGERWRRNRA